MVVTQLLVRQILLILSQWVEDVEALNLLQQEAVARAAAQVILPLQIEVPGLVSQVQRNKDFLGAHVMHLFLADLAGTEAVAAQEGQGRVEQTRVRSQILVQAPGVQVLIQTLLAQTLPMLAAAGMEVSPSVLLVELEA